MRALQMIQIKIYEVLMKENAVLKLCKQKVLPKNGKKPKVARDQSKG